MLGLQNEREWQLFCLHVLQQPELSHDERFASNALRSANRSTLKSLLDRVFARLTVDELVVRLEAAQIANARVNSLDALWVHPQLQARNRWVSIGSSVGELPALLPPGASDARQVRMDAVPALGQHTRAVLTELGWAPQTLEALHAEGVIDLAG
jgi:itaconate CoA-transferase